jgi:hypothetical protein
MNVEPGGGALFWWQFVPSAWSAALRYQLPVPSMILKCESVQTNRFWV